MSFREIVGHSRILGLLSRSLSARSLPPSLMLAGPKGVGKRRVAQAVAQALNCISPISGSARPRPDATLDACGECPACRRIARGIHSDVEIVTPGESGAIRIEQVREVIAKTIYRPFEGKRRVTIIDEADALVPSAQHALLKTLEEPPPSSVFILVTSRPDALLPTVRSRCSQMRFGRLSPGDVATVLERDHKYAKRDALAVAAASDGSVGRALNAQAEEFSEALGDAEALLRSTRTRGDARTRVERAKDLVKGGAGPAASEREHLSLRLQALASLVRDLGILTTGADPALLANIDLRPDLEGLAGSFDSERSLQVFAAVWRAQSALDRNVSPKTVADWLALQI
ncbi:MAG: DNA polymerase III subunit delta' [Acidobacteria bacterium]|nr:DNA polymerase III subunit delta' [Acidobacteriota bacterium]